jgi:hypothetical protein
MRSPMVERGGVAAAKQLLAAQRPSDRFTRLWEMGRLDTISRGQRNIILRIEGGDVVVATERAPSGTPVRIDWVQAALDRLYAAGEVRVDVPTLGHRSSFIGAVLRELPEVDVLRRPQRIRLRPTYGSTSPRRIA